MNIPTTKHYNSGNRSQWRRSKCPPKLCASARVTKNHADQVFRTSISCFTDGQLNWQIPLRDMPARNPSWQPFISAGKFLQSPTHLELAIQLERLGECDCANVKPRRPWMSWTSWLPWPLGVCLTLCSSEQLLAVAKSAREGALGEFSDWREAEQRRLSKGITLSDIEYVPDPPMPFDRSVGGVGFPFEPKPMLSTEGYGIADPLAALNAFDELACTRISPDISVAVTWALAAQAEHHFRRSPDYSAFRKLLPLIPAGSLSTSGLYLSCSLNRSNRAIWRT
jgi:hypothetical protein